MYSRRISIGRPVAALTACLITSLVVLSLTSSASALLLGRVAGPSARPAAAGPSAAKTAAAVTDLAPSDLQAAYSLPSTGAPGQKIAVISAYDDPTAASDLSKYLSAFKLSACTAANGCFRKVNQSGQAAPLPRADPTGGNWITESALGTEIARGLCQSCSILLVEANGATEADLSTAVATAARMGAQVIETSFSPPEQAGDSAAYQAAYTHPGSVVVAASGDLGYTGGVTFPAALPNVISVGGTQLKFDSSGNYGGETVWNSSVGASGSGCSLYTSAPLWQAAFAKGVGCGSKRAVSDISAVAAPGALVYISNVQGTRGGGWYPAEGTSLSSPVIAAAIGLAGGGSSSSAALLYQRARTTPRAFRDIRSGVTTGCVKQPICAAGSGYDGPTGLGSPHGLAAFFPAGGAIDRKHPFVTLTTRNGKLQVSRGWIASLALRNRNPFTVRATITLRSSRRLRFARRLQKIDFATGRASLSPLASSSIKLSISRRYRGLLAQLHEVPVQATVVVRGPQGGSVTISAQVRLRAT